MKGIEKNEIISSFLEYIAWGLAGGCKGVQIGLPLQTLRQPYGNPKVTPYEFWIGIS